MRLKSSNAKSPNKKPAEQVIKDSAEQHGAFFAAEDKIRIVLPGDDDEQPDE